MKANLLELANGDPVLAGSPAGRRMRKALLKMASATTQRDLFLLNFSGIDVATSSYLREAVVEFRKSARQEFPELYPVLTKLSAEVEEELVTLLNQMGEAFWLFEVDGRGTVRKRRLIGRLDPKIKEALDLIETGRGFDALALWKSTNSTESVGVTAWNNRLASLSKQGLVFEFRSGKQKFFRPLAEMGA